VLVQVNTSGEASKYGLPPDEVAAFLRELRARLREEAPDGIALDELSMGMSGDYEIAVEEGATVVRVGQAIFGARATPDAYYWPLARERE
jgi:PLP dependent protein